VYLPDAVGLNRALLASVAAIVVGACTAGPGDGFTDGSRADAQALERHVEERAGRLLAPGERLTVAIADIDRAGRTEPWRPGLGTTRVVRDVYPARITLSFRLAGADGTLLKEGMRQLGDLPVAAAAVHGNDPLRYEKALLDDWLERELRR
jgi:hypothetical protein